MNLKKLQQVETKLQESVRAADAKFQKAAAFSKSALEKSRKAKATLKQARKAAKLAKKEAKQAITLANEEQSALAQAQQQLNKVAKKLAKAARKSGPERKKSSIGTGARMKGVRAPATKRTRKLEVAKRPSLTVSEKPISSRATIETESPFSTVLPLSDKTNS